MPETTALSISLKQVDTFLINFPAQGGVVQLICPEGHIPFSINYLRSALYAGHFELLIEFFEHLLSVEAYKELI